MVHVDVFKVTGVKARYIDHYGDSFATLNIDDKDGGRVVIYFGRAKEIRKFIDELQKILAKMEG